MNTGGPWLSWSQLSGSGIISGSLKSKKIPKLNFSKKNQFGICQKNDNNWDW